MHNYVIKVDITTVSLCNIYIYIYNLYILHKETIVIHTFMT